MKKKKSSISGIDANIIVLVCYLGALLLSWFNDARYLAWLLPLIIYIIERDSEFVKKHAAQATLLYAFYSFIALVLTGLSMVLFPNINIFNVDFSNFAGSLLLLSAMSMLSVGVLVVVTILGVIAASKTWHYEDYNIVVVKDFVPRFRKWMDKLMQNNSNKEQEKEKDIILEEDSEVILDIDIPDDEVKRAKPKKKESKDKEESKEDK